MTTSHCNWEDYNKYLVFNEINALKKKVKNSV